MHLHNLRIICMNFIFGYILNLLLNDIMWDVDLNKRRTYNKYMYLHMKTFLYISNDKHEILSLMTHFINEL